jgi:hypothetical protein
MGTLADTDCYEVWLYMLLTGQLKGQYCQEVLKFLHISLLWIDGKMSLTSVILTSVICATPSNKPG